MYARHSMIKERSVLHHNSLPVLENVVGLYEHINLENITFVCVQHGFYTNINLIDALLQLGARPQNIYFTSKSYSTCTKVINQLLALGINYIPEHKQLQLGQFSQSSKQQLSHVWNTLLEKTKLSDIEGIILIDDGAKAHRAAPDHVLSSVPVIGIEQTTFGLITPSIKQLTIPSILVATSAAKQYLESPLIAKAVINKLLSKASQLDLQDKTCAVIGLGAIGKALYKQLTQMNCSVIAFDKFTTSIPDEIHLIPTLENTIKSADIIFGCTGTDIMAPLNFQDVLNKDKTFISCSSEDREFNSLLHFIQNKNPQQNYNVLNTIECFTKDEKCIKIISGGFPVNLDKSGHSVPSSDIQLTRGLLLSAVIQAKSYLLSDEFLTLKSQTMLSPHLQQFVVNKWLSVTPPNHLPTSLTNPFAHTQWIRAKSQGHYNETNILANIHKRQQHISP